MHISTGVCPFCSITDRHFRRVFGGFIERRIGKNGASIRPECVKVSEGQSQPRIDADERVGQDTPRSFSMWWEVLPAKLGEHHAAGGA